MMNRRNFIEKTGLAAGLSLLANQGLWAGNKEDDVIRRRWSKPDPNKVKIGLYSISYLGIWYDGPALSWEEMVDRAKKFGYDGIELDNKRPMGNPMDLDQRRRDEMRNVIERAGLEIPCVAANNDFSSPIPEHRECQLMMVKETARLARDLGAKVVRLFAAWPGVPIHNGLGTYELIRGDYYTFERQYPYVTWLDRWNLAKDGLKEAAEFGEEFGVIMALQNHAPLIKHWKHTYDMVKEVNSPWLKVCLDAPIMINHSREWVEEAALTTGPLQVHSHYGGEFKKDSNGNIAQKQSKLKFGQDLPDYPFFMEKMKEIGYEGYFTFEFCHSALNEAHEPEGIDFIDEQVEMAQLYMREIVDKVYGRPAK